MPRDILLKCSLAFSSLNILLMEPLLNRYSKSVYDLSYLGAAQLEAGEAFF
jgi:hypothetical protein